MQSCDLQTKCKIVDRLLNICQPDHPMNQNFIFKGHYGLGNQHFWTKLDRWSTPGIDSIPI